MPKQPICLIIGIILQLEVKLKKIKVFKGGETTIIEKYVNNFLVENNLTKTNDSKLYFSSAVQDKIVWHTVMIEYDDKKV